MRSRSAARGYTVVWILVVIALFAVMLGSIELSVDSRPREPALLWAFGIGLTVAVLGLLIEARRDMYSAAVFMTVCSLIALLITGSIVIYGQGSHPLAFAASILSALILAGNVGYLVRWALRKETLPNVLAELVPKESIREIDGVQFAVVSHPIEGDASEWEIIGLVQNCWSAPRRFVLELDLHPRLQGHARGEIELPATAVGKIELRVRGRPGASGEFDVWIAPSVSGLGGVRARHWRARAHERRMTGGIQALALLGGLIVWGGGMKVRINIAPSSAILEMTPEPVREIIWG